MSNPTGPDPRRARERFVDAATDEQRLRELARQERAEEQRWTERAALASERGRPELAAQAEAQAAHHRGRAEIYEGELARMTADIEHLRQVARNPGLEARPDPERAALAAQADLPGRQLDELAEEERLDQDLTELKARMGRLPPSGGEPAGTSEEAPG